MVAAPAFGFTFDRMGLSGVSAPTGARSTSSSIARWSGSSGPLCEVLFSRSAGSGVCCVTDRLDRIPYALPEAACWEKDNATKSTNARTRTAN